MKTTKTVTRMSRWKILDFAFLSFCLSFNTPPFLHSWRSFLLGFGGLHAFWRLGLDDLSFSSKAQKQVTRAFSVLSSFLLLQIPTIQRVSNSPLTSHTSYRPLIRLRSKFTLIQHVKSLYNFSSDPYLPCEKTDLSSTLKLSVRLNCSRTRSMMMPGDPRSMNSFM
jgi:hypothetical protein